MSLTTDLETFAAQKFRGKGALSVALVLTEQVKGRLFPVNPADFLTKQGGQVLGLGRDAVQTILRQHGITQVLAQEGGRTSRGSIARMQEYLTFLNQLAAINDPIVWLVVEGFWIAKVKAFFSATPFKLSLDATQSGRALGRSLVRQATDRQREQPRATLPGTMMPHLVGAKLSLIGVAGLTHHSAHQNDQDANRTGGFDLGDVSLHVTSRPTESLLLKCQANLEADRRPLIITLPKGLTTAEVLAENIGIADRIEIIDFEQFTATNIHEHSQFAQPARRARPEELVISYNALITTVEGDDGRLKISLV